MTVKRTPKSRVVREALTEGERDKALAAFDRAIADVPKRPRGEVLAELQQLAVSRGRGGRRRG